MKKFLFLFCLFINHSILFAQTEMDFHADVIGSVLSFGSPYSEIVQGKASGMSYSISLNTAIYKKLFLKSEIGLLQQHGNIDFYYYEGGTKIQTRGEFDNNKTFLYILPQYFFLNDHLYINAGIGLYNDFYSKYSNGQSLVNSNYSNIKGESLPSGLSGAFLGNTGIRIQSGNFLYSLNLGYRYISTVNTLFAYKQFSFGFSVGYVLH